MVELIIEETGFPKNRETLREFQDSFAVPIHEILDRLPGRRILSGFEFTHGGGGSTSSTEGIILYNSLLWTIEPFAGSVGDTQFISFFETIEDMSFNVGTQANPIYDDRPGKIRRTAKIGTHAGRKYLAETKTFIRGRKQLEYLKAGSIFVGNVTVSVGTATYHIDFGGNIGTKDYQVLANFRSADPEQNFTRAFVWDINNRKATGFDVMINSATVDSVPLIFDYTVIPINRVEPTPTP